LQLFAWRLETNPIYFIGAVGALFLLWGESHKLGSLFAIPYRLWGMLLTGSVLVLLSIYDFNKDMFRHGHAFDGFVQTLAILVLAVATVAATLLVQRRFGGDFIPFSVRVADLIQRESLPFVLVLFMLLLALWESIACSLGTRELTLTALVPTVLANVAMIGCAFWLIVVGLREDRTRPFAAGVFYFLLWAVLRYVDLFGDFGGMLGAALMFFLCGATLFGVALYWRQRKGVRHA
jgi:hypothetical protein